MDSSGKAPIPGRAETLKVLALMGDYLPILMLVGDADGFGARWTIDGQPVQPAIATYLMQSGFIADSGVTELGARKLALTESGAQFCRDGQLWWASLSLWQQLKILIFG